MILRPVRPVSPMRSADDEAARRIDVVLGVGVEQFGRNRGLNHVLQNVSAKFSLVDVLGVLRGDNYGVDANGLRVGVVFNGDLRFAVGTEIRKRSVLADFG